MGMPRTQDEAMEPLRITSVREEKSVNELLAEFGLERSAHNAM